MKLRFSCFLVTVVAFTAILAGCGKSESPAQGQGTNVKKLQLAFVPNNSANFWTIARRGCEEAEKQLGNVQLKFRMPSTGSAAEQQQILDDLLALGVDGIAVSPVDPENQTAALIPPCFAT